MSDSDSKSYASLSPLDLDPLLAYIAREVAFQDQHADLTLTVRGVVISGTLVSPVAYADFLTQVFPNAADQVRANAASMRARIDQEAAQQEDQDEPLPRWPGMLHLRDAVLLTSNGTLVQLGWYRCRIGSVDGWAIGRLIG